MISEAVEEISGKRESCGSLGRVSECGLVASDTLKTKYVRQAPLARMDSHHKIVVLMDCMAETLLNLCASVLMS